MFRKHHPRAGSRPGTLLIPPDAPDARIRVVQYQRESVTEMTVHDPARLRQLVRPEHVTWIDVQGFGDGEVLQQIAEQFGIHPLAMEDIVNVPQRPKTEYYGQQLLIIARQVLDAETGQVTIGQLSMVVGPGYVITFDDHHHDRLECVRQRIASPSARLRRNGADYLAYVLLDTIVDAWYPVLTSYGERLEALEDRVVSQPHPALLRQVNRLKNHLAELRRSIWPQRDAVRSLLADESGILTETSRTFLRDTYDHCVQISEAIETYRETATGLLNLYLSAVAHRSNEVMKVLTIMSSIFVPMTFVAGVYGMNFEHMPELQFAWSYPAVWGLMLATAGGMLWYFRWKGWIRMAKLSDWDPAGEVNSRTSPPSENARRPFRVLEHDKSSDPAFLRVQEAVGVNDLPDHHDLPDNNQLDRVRPRSRRAA